MPRIFNGAFTWKYDLMRFSIAVFVLWFIWGKAFNVKIIMRYLYFIMRPFMSLILKLACLCPYSTKRKQAEKWSFSPLAV